MSSSPKALLGERKVARELAAVHAVQHRLPHAHRHTRQRKQTDPSRVVHARARMFVMLSFCWTHESMLGDGNGNERVRTTEEGGRKLFCPYKRNQCSRHKPATAQPPQHHTRPIAGPGAGKRARSTIEGETTHTLALAVPSLETVPPNNP
jgi:hypothetical protein